MTLGEPTHEHGTGTVHHAIFLCFLLMEGSMLALGPPGTLCDHLCSDEWVLSCGKLHRGQRNLSL